MPEKTRRTASPSADGDAETAQDEPFDPYDVDALRANPPAIVAEAHLLTVPVRKPNKTEFFRVHPDPAFSVDGTIVEYEGETAREDFWVPPQMRRYVGDEARPVRLFVGINTFAVRFLWPARLPVNEFGRRWQDSALAAAELAKTEWVRLRADRAAGGYNVMRATGDLGEPQWGDETLGMLIKLGFGAGRVIDSRDHPVLRRLRGEG